jgi:alpha-ketoglutarate-dependent taurine dioxygenase
MTLKVTPLSDAFGAEITGIDVSQPLDDETFGAIRDALHEYQVIAIRDQKLTPEEQKEFGARFGGLDIHISPANKMKDHPEILMLSNRKVDGEWVGAIKTGDVVIWDNRCTLHKAMGNIEPPGIRHIHRVTMTGDVPY